MTIYKAPQPPRERDQKIKISISVDALAKLWLVGERAHVKLTGPAVAGRIIEEICKQDQVKQHLTAWRNRKRRERHAADATTSVQTL